MSIFTSHVPAARKVGVVDVFVIAFVFGLLYLTLDLGSDMNVPFSPEDKMTVSSNPGDLPYYAGRSLIRMFIAYIAAIIFTLVYASIAAKNRFAEKILMPLLDVLQSVPVLGFLSVTVTLFISIFPGSLIGVEMASIFAIFTGQVWNMTFSFYHSLVTMPSELKEASHMLRFNWWQRFTRLEIPFAMNGLVWNSMASFGNGWFFLAASEAITVLNKSVFLPGIGSFMAAAAERGDMTALGYSVLAMVIVIILLDQFFWRPIMAWSQKFKMTRSDLAEPPASFVYDIFQRSVLVKWLKDYLLNPAGSAVNAAFNSLAELTGSAYGKMGEIRHANYLPLIAKYSLLAIVISFTWREAYQGILMMSSLGGEKLFEIIRLGFYTLGRVMACCLLAVLWTVPVGVAIGTNPFLSRVLQPVVQVAASFPANMIYPFAALFYLNYSINFEWASIPLMMLGTQWYILFNVIAGAMAIPTELKDAATIFKMSRLQKWRRLILPSIFPYVVTGCITASGGAWNASIVSEIISWEDNELAATGLGTFISQVTAVGDWPGIISGIAIMCGFVIVVNRLLWSRLYKLAENKYKPY